MTFGITVVTPCYNQARYLAIAIQSVLAQTVENFQYLLIDDGSTDKTWDVMQAYAKLDPRINCLQLSKQKNVGVVLNRSIREATGDYWVWCPSDDRLLPEMLEKGCEFARKYPNCVGYSGGEVIDSDGKVTHRRWSDGDRTPTEFAELVWKKSPIGFTGIWIPMGVFDRVGNFPTHLKYSEDFEWMIRATIHKVRFRRIPGVLYQKRVHPNRNTDQNLQRILDQVPEIRKNLHHYRAIMDKAYG